MTNRLIPAIKTIALAAVFTTVAFAGPGGGYPQLTGPGGSTPYLTDGPGLGGGYGPNLIR